MNHGFGIEKRGAHRPAQHQKPAKYLVVIDAAGSMVARLFDAERREVADFDASSQEVSSMTRGLAPSKGAEAPEWDDALESHSVQERIAAEVYSLDV